MIAWQFTASDPEVREKTALRVIAFSFFALATDVTVTALLGLTGVWTVEHSVVGVVLTALSLVVMPVLSWFERRTGRQLGSASTVADSRHALICAYLSGAALIGLLANLWLGWRWADPIAALAIVGFADREGREAWRGEACTVPVSALTGEREPEEKHVR